METSELTNVVLRKRMRERGVTQTTLARMAGLQQSEVSGILGGWIRLGPQREERLAAGIIRLGLDRDEPAEPPPTPPAASVVIRIRRT
jgi:predicted transcriptional regulator